MNLLGVHLGEGNAKVGGVLTFSLPSGVTCPGASPWCRRHCYGWRFERYRSHCQRAYAQNYQLAQDPRRFVHQLTGVLPRLLPCLRLHVSGDFFSAPYAAAWGEICRSFPAVRFWGYTRSWCRPELRSALEGLRALKNVQLFASLDPTMAEAPPAGWRVAYLEHDPRARGLACPEQRGARSSCLACGYCFRRRAGDVIFRVR